MKTKLAGLIIAIAVCAATPVIFVGSGCATAGGNTTNGIPQSTIDATAVVIKGAAQAGVLAAVQQDANNAQYFQLAADSISTFLVATNYTPGAFQQSLLAVVGPGALQNTYVAIGLGTVIDLYELYFGQYVKGQVNGNAYAGEFLKAIQDGFYLGLGKPVPQAHRMSAEAPAGVLPRPIIAPRK